MKTYFTLGQSHAHRLDNVTVDKDYIIEISAKTHKEARQIMFDTFGQQWSNQYNKLKDLHLEYYPKGIVKLN